MEVLTEDHDPIPGLYAGGDTAGGWEEPPNYNKDLSGSAFGFALNSGRIAGENAVKYSLGKK
jgi:fumarate reductase flavoprotein subunit